MKYFSKIIALGGAFLCLSSVFASNPTTFLGPTVRGVYTAPITPDTAYSVAIEPGVKSERIGGALGWRLADNQRLKVAAEYLWQDITYHFFAGNTNQWVNQGAIAGYYQYDFVGQAYKPQFGLNAYFSHAPSKNLSTVTGTFISKSGVSTSFTDTRRIAGSNAAGISPGITFQPWIGGKLGLDLNYDDVRYDTKHISSRNAVGFGGTAHASQALSQNVSLNLAAGIRQPFNDYQADIAWTTDNSYGRWVFGVGGDYSVGKNTLPNTYNIGVTVNYFADCMSAPQPQKTQWKEGSNWKDPAPVVNDLLAWTVDPVIMPRVLAIADETVVPACTDVPAFTGTIADETEDGTLTTTIATAGHFTGHDLTFSVSAVQTAGAGSGTVTIDPTTGVVSATILRATFTVVVTATNSCGSISSNTFTLSSLSD